MNKLNGSVEYVNKSGDTNEDVLFTYSEEEKQTNEINAANAKLVFTPEFIPYYPAIQKEFGLTDTETKIYGFVRFYLSNNEKGRFYFTDNQISGICNCSPDTCNRAIKVLNDKKLLVRHTKIKANGGKIRFLTDIFYKSYPSKTTSHTRQKLQKNNNKINNNNSNNSIVAKATSHLKEIIINNKNYMAKSKHPMAYLVRKYLELSGTPIKAGGSYDANPIAKAIGGLYRHFGKDTKKTEEYMAKAINYFNKKKLTYNPNTLLRNVYDMDRWISEEQKGEAVFAKRELK